MAVYPSLLPLPSWSYRAAQNTGVEQGLLTSKPRQQRVSYDNQVTYSLVFEFTKGQARLFRQWYIEQLARGKKQFTINLLTANGIEAKTIRFVADRRPALSILQNVIFQYTADAVGRK